MTSTTWAAVVPGQRVGVDRCLRRVHEVEDFGPTPSGARYLHVRLADGTLLCVLSTEKVKVMP